ncbi:hypothetical protein PFISCL1PPCAC_22154, partial [Pristionchus fissidentatus]
DLPSMSTFTSTASLRQQCLILSSDSENIINAHGPFLDSYNLAKWERKKSKPTETPVRVNVFEDVRIDTVLPLGTSGHAIAVSSVARDETSKQYKVYATLVHSADLAKGGYVSAALRFVICSQPLTETPCQPIVNIVPESSKLLVLTRSSLRVFELECDSEEKCTGWSEVEWLDIRDELGPKFRDSKSIRPLFISPIYPFEYALLVDARLTVLTYKQPRKNNK